MLFIIKPERGAGAEMVLVEAGGTPQPGPFPVISSLLHAGWKTAVPPTSPTVDFRCRASTAGSGSASSVTLLGRLSPPDRSVARQRLRTGDYARLATALMQVPIVIDHWHGFTRFNDKRRCICRVLKRVTT